MFALLLPFIVLLTARFKGSFARRLRLFVYSIFRVDILAKQSLILIFASSLFLLFHLLVGTSQLTYLVTGMLVLNISLSILFIFMLNGHFQIRQPTALLIRKQGTAEVYLCDKGELRWIPDPQTLHLLGYSFEDITNIDESEFKTYTHRASIESITSARLIRTANRPEVWVVFGEFRKWIPDESTLMYIQHLNQRQIEEVTDTQFQGWREYAPLPSIVLVR